MFALILSMSGFLFLLAFLCALEAAWFKVTPAKLQALPSGKRLEATRKILRQQPIVLNHILFLIMVATYFGSAIIHKQEQDLPTWMLWTVRAFPLLMFYFGEIIPKFIGIRYAAAICVRTTLLMRLTLLIIYPLTLLNRWTWTYLGGKVETVREEDVRDAARAAAHDGHLQPVEADLLEQMMHNGNRQVHELMLPIDKCAKLPATTSGEQIREQGQEKPRFLLVHDDDDNIIGYITARQILAMLPINGEKVKLSAHRNAFTFVGANQLLQDILPDLLRNEVVGVLDGGKLVGILTQAYFFSEAAKNAVR